MKSLLLFIVAVCLASLNSCQEFTTATARLLASTDTAGVVFPAPLGSVSDYGKKLTDEQIHALDSIIVLHEDKSSYKINIVTTKSIKPYTNLHDYGMDLQNNWENGNEKGNSVMIIFSDKLDQAQITTGKNVKKKLTEKECKRIVKKTMIPEFKKGDYFTGLKKGLQKIISEIN